jgi:hypothetical protein
MKIIAKLGQSEIRKFASGKLMEAMSVLNIDLNGNKGKIGEAGWKVRRHLTPHKW